MRWLLLLCISFPCVSVADVVYSTNRITWKDNVGVPGGMPRRSTISTTLFPGATAANINSALSSAATNSVVYLSNGTYNISQINFGALKGKTLRGAGMHSTILNISAAGDRCIKSGSDNFNGTGINVTAGATKGSTNITLASMPAGFTVGGWMAIDHEDDTNFIYTSGGPGRRLASTHKVLSISGNDMTFWPALTINMTGLDPEAIYNDAQAPQMQSCSIEDLTINDVASSSVMVEFQGWGWWISGCLFSNAGDRAIFCYQSIGVEIRSNRFDEVEGYPESGDGFGVVVQEGSSGVVVEDNIFVHQGNPILINSSSGNVISYNFFLDSDFGVDTGWQITDMNGCHFKHPDMNLWEGNYAGMFQTDVYHGSAGRQILFRNVLHGTNANSNNGRRCVDLGRSTYWSSVVGNVLCDPSWTNHASFAYENLTGQASFATVQCAYRLGFPNSGNAGDDETAGNMWGDDYGKFATYFDADTKNRLFRHGNFVYGFGLLWDGANSDHDIPNSLIHESKPSWFGACPWPPFDPLAGTDAQVLARNHPTNNPAGARYFGVFGAGDGTPAAPSSLSATAVSASQINLSWTDNSSDEDGFEVQRDTDSGFGTATLTGGIAADATSYNSTSLSAATTYYYRVRATNEIGASSWSASANASTFGLGGTRGARLRNFMRPR